MIFHIKLYFVCLLIQSLQSTNIHLNSNNRFDDMLVFINDNVDEDGGALLTRIKDHLSKASKSLWKATSNMHPNKAGVQFGTVYIRLPETWQAIANPITWQQCNKANFYITVDNEGSNQPFTKQLGRCGVPGDFTRFPKIFFRSKSENETFQTGKQIMNEFVKLRYGVFDEKPYRNRLTTFDGLNFINSTCGKDIQWTINKDKMKCVEPNKDCKYTIVPNQTHNYSVMFDTTTHSSEFFCDDERNPHNKYAINLQNRFCNRQSITKVILRHQDFKMNKTKLPYENVNFVIVKGTSRRMALVLDVSGSMTGIIGNMKKAAAEYISQVERSAYLGIVIFSTLADIKSGLVPLKSKQNRDNLINIINALHHYGLTNIPDGLAKGVQVLGGDISNDAKMFGSITLLTDGQNNQDSPFGYDYVISQLIKKGILVNAIAYGKSADANLDKLTQGTGGKYFYSDTSKPYVDLLGHFSVKQSCDIQISESLVNEGNLTLDLVGKIHQENLTFIDKYLGVNVKFTLTVPRAKSHYKVTVIDPKGKRIDQKDRFDQASGITLTFVIPGRPETGMYQIEFVSASRLRFRRTTDFLTITYTVSAAQEPNSTRIIKPTGALSDSQIEMLSDSSTIQAIVDLTTCGILKEENVTVILIMDAPYKNSIQIPMLDDGMGDDSVEDDKIFTRNLLPADLKDIGFYNFRANVKILNKKTEDIIERSVQLGSLRVKDKQQAPIVDKIPPAKIEFVKIDIINSKKKELKVEITAPGNDGMNGNISNYEIMVKFKGTEHIKNQTAKSQPKESIQFEVDLSKLNVTNPFEISVRGIDDKLNYGEWSLPKIYNWEYEKIANILNKKKKCGTKNLVSFWTILLCVQFVFRN